MSYNNAMVAHVWAQREKSRGQSSNGNFSFEGPILYSYSTPIAAFVEAGKQTVVLVISRTYSNTRSGKHMPPAWRAVHGLGLPRFYVPNVRPAGESDHKANLAHLVNNYVECRNRFERVRDFYFSNVQAGILEWLTDLADAARDYAKLFKVKAPRLDPRKDTDSVMAKRAAREAKANTPAAIARRAKAAAAREAKRIRTEELQQATWAEKIAAWQAGEIDYLPHAYGQQGTYLRVKGQQLQTSLGASVPLEHAIRVYRFVKLCRERGEAWQRNGRSLRVGHFQVDSVAPDGSFRAGCHHIRWPAIEAAAQQAGVTELAPEDTREGEAA